MKNNILFAALAFTALALPAYALDTAATRLMYARQAVVLNSPHDALTNGTSPLASTPMFAQIISQLDFNKINEQAAQIMAQTFTVDEIKALVEFQKSSVGQQIILKMPGYQRMVGAIVQNEMKGVFDTLTLQNAAQQQGAGGLMQQQQPVYATPQNIPMTIPGLPAGIPSSVPAPSLPGMPSAPAADTNPGTPIGQ